MTQGVAADGRTPTGHAMAVSRSSGRFSRKVVPGLMNALIVVPIEFAFLTVWGGIERQSSAHDVSAGVLRISGARAHPPATVGAIVGHLYSKHTVAQLISMTRSPS